MNTKIMSVQDISCFGQCSLTVALPILSSFGYETAILPSAILSTHTSGFKDFTVRDLTEDLGGIVAHWERENISFGCIYTGYVGDCKQFGTILKAKDTVLDKDGIFVVDPAVGDNGKLYPALDNSIVEGMRSIVRVADYVLPNITEASLLTNIPYKSQYDRCYIEQLLNALIDMGAKTPIITGVQYDDKHIGATAEINGKIVEVFGEKQPISYHGTGDIFSSLIVVGLMNNEPIDQVLRRAVDFVIDCIKCTASDYSHRYGVKFEQVLKSKKYL